MNDQSDRPDDTAPVQGSGSRWEPGTPPSSDDGAAEQPGGPGAPGAPGVPDTPVPAADAVAAREEKRGRLRRGGIVGSVAAAVLLVGGGAGFAIGHATGGDGDSDGPGRIGFGHDRGDRDREIDGDGHRGPDGPVPADGTEDGTDDSGVDQT